jgi:cell wall-associated NlpC family hydrolase
VIVVALAIAGNSKPHHAAAGGAGHGSAATLTVHASPDAGRAVAYARTRLGHMYCWGGPTSGSCPAGTYDCSGLAQAAWSAAGVPIPRVARDQWAGLRHVRSPRPGDLVFFAGADGSMTEPGHVGIVVRKGLMIEAFGTGYPIRYSHYRTRSDLVGFARP